MTLYVEQAFTPIGLKPIPSPKNHYVEKMNIVWFKRDLRLADHKPLQCAIQEGHPLLLLYIQEPELWENEHMDHRHNRCIYQSLQSMNNQLTAFNQRIVVMEGNPLDVFKYIHQRYSIHHVFSHQETGLRQTYQRDLQLKDFFLESSILWKEFQRNGVLRGLKNRDTWKKAWYIYMNSPIHKVDYAQLPHPPSIDSIPEFDWPAKLTTPNKHVQRIGLGEAQDTMTSFLSERGRYYMQNISKPETSATHCSRLSPFLVYGNLSIRQVFQASLNQQEFGWKRNMASFRSRLRWHDHFIQKFEMEDRMEFEHVNKGYDLLKKARNNNYLESWATGMTGFPLVDACMRCLQATGYVNFRMRAMVVSFLTHHLWQDWRRGSPILSKYFLDFEPGIHFSQFQMQAGVTGINTVRMYNPVKQSMDNDSEGNFIKRWVPELSNVPIQFIHEPWKLTALDRKFLNIDNVYPDPIINHIEAGREARKRIWSIRNHPAVREESKRILKRHTLPGRRNA